MRTRAAQSRVIRGTQGTVPSVPPAADPVEILGARRARGDRGPGAVGPLGAELVAVEGLPEVAPLADRAGVADHRRVAAGLVDDDVEAREAGSDQVDRPAVHRARVL